MQFGNVAVKVTLHHGLEFHKMQIRNQRGRRHEDTSVLGERLQLFITSFTVLVTQITSI